MSKIDFFISATADTASPNRRFFRMHKYLQGDSEMKDVIYLIKTFMAHSGYIYCLRVYLSYLIKTARNCFMQLWIWLVMQHDTRGTVDFFFSGHNLFIMHF